MSDPRVMAMLRRNVAYGDATGSTLGAGYLGGGYLGGGYLGGAGVLTGGCEGCGKACMHCGMGYLGGFKGERKLFSGYPKTKAGRAAKKQAVEEYFLNPLNYGKNMLSHQDVVKYHARKKRVGNASALQQFNLDVAHLREQNPAMSLAEARADVKAAYAYARSQNPKKKYVKPRKGCDALQKGRKEYCEWQERFKPQFVAQNGYAPKPLDYAVCHAYSRQARGLKLSKKQLKHIEDYNCNLLVL